MSQTKFSLEKKGIKYYFSNKKLFSRNKFFEDKLRGIKILAELMADERITKCDALELLEAIISVREMPLSPKCANQYDADLLAMMMIGTIRDGLRLYASLETERGLPKFKVCENCGQHGEIIGSDFVTTSLFSKERAHAAVGDLLGEGKINRTEEKEIRSQIDASNLPPIDQEDSVGLN